MFKRSTTNVESTSSSILGNVYRRLENRIKNSLQATPNEVEKAAKQIEDQVETLVAEKLEAQILENRRNLLSQTLQDAEEQQKHTPY